MSDQIVNPFYMVSRIRDIILGEFIFWSRLGSLFLDTICYGAVTDYYILKLIFTSLQIQHNLSISLLWFLKFYKLGRSSQLGCLMEFSPAISLGNFKNHCSKIILWYLEAITKAGAKWIFFVKVPWRLSWGESRWVGQRYSTYGKPGCFSFSVFELWYLNTVVCI